MQELADRIDSDQAEQRGPQFERRPEYDDEAGREHDLSRVLPGPVEVERVGRDQLARFVRRPDQVVADEDEDGAEAEHLQRPVQPRRIVQTAPDAGVHVMPGENRQHDRRERRPDRQRDGADAAEAAEQDQRCEHQHEQDRRVRGGRGRWPALVAARFGQQPEKETLREADAEPGPGDPALRSLALFRAFRQQQPSG
jgi:hypothetical protein